MRRYRSDEFLAYLLRQIERDMVDLVSTGQFTIGDVQTIFAGWFKQLDITPAHALRENGKPLETDTLTI